MPASYLTSKQWSSASQLVQAQPLARARRTQSDAQWCTPQLGLEHLIRHFIEAGNTQAAVSQESQGLLSFAILQRLLAGPVPV